LVGGNSGSSDVVNLYQSLVPILVRINENNGRAIWHKQLV